MTSLRFSITMSLDGYIAGPNQSVTDPLGERGHELHKWAFATRSAREQHGMEGGTTGPDDAIVAESLQNIGSTIMGRHMFGGGDGPWGDNPWRGWWGENPPFHTPVFVLTHHARNSIEMQGGTTFHFVTDGIHAALDRARNAAGGKDIALGGGADVAQQYLKAGLIDEMEIHVVPLLLGGGARLFANMDARQTAYECIRIVNSPSVSHYKYRLRGFKS
ncbi:MAG TPA: dihydrofolate reductase family protein [Thermoanaerobaculia bacterium]|nr:dihydrofolate reductase family protein [Thermoanaerobaculia bacterium]